MMNDVETPKNRWEASCHFLITICGEFLAPLFGFTALVVGVVLLIPGIVCATLEIIVGIVAIFRWILTPNSSFFQFINIPPIVITIKALVAGSMLLGIHHLLSKEFGNWYIDYRYYSYKE